MKFRHEKNSPTVVVGENLAKLLCILKYKFVCGLLSTARRKEGFRFGSSTSTFATVAGPLLVFWMPRGSFHLAGDSSGAGGETWRRAGGGWHLRRGGRVALGRLSTAADRGKEHVYPTSSRFCEARNRANIPMDDGVPYSDCSTPFIRTHCTGPLSTIGI